MRGSESAFYLYVRCHMCVTNFSAVASHLPTSLDNRTKMLKLLIFVSCCVASGWSAGNPDVQEVFDPNSGEESYQRRYVISVLNKAEDCYYIPEVRTNQIVNFHFVVSHISLYRKS